MYNKHLALTKNWYGAFCDEYHSVMIEHFTNNSSLVEEPVEITKVQTHLNVVKEMLHSRQDLIHHFFAYPTFSKREAGMMFKYYWTQLPLFHAHNANINFQNEDIVVKKKGKVTLSDSELEQLADCANQFGLFSTIVDKEDMGRLFFCYGSCLQLSQYTPQQAYGVFVAAVQSKDRLYSNWQKAMAFHNAVMKSNGKPFTVKDYDNMKQRLGWSSKYDALKEAVLDVLS